MSKKSGKELLVGLDIGTSKVVALVGEIGQDGNLKIVGVGHHPSKGLRKGVVVNIEATVHAISCAIEEAELMAGCEIHSVYTGIAGSHIHSLNSHGIVAIRDNEVTSTDIERVIDAAKAVVISNDQKILHILPQEFIVDSQEGIRDPIGMSGVRLEARVHIVTGAISAAQNIVKCVRRCGLEVDNMILEQLASSQAILSEDEKELGVCLVDIGGGTTDIAVFLNGAICHTAVIPIAGDQITNDIAVALRTPTLNAENLKINYGTVFNELNDENEFLEVPSMGERPSKKLSRRNLTLVIEPRYEELLALIYTELQKSGFLDSLVSGVVFTGGSAKMPGLLELAEDILNLPVRLGYPQHIAGIGDIANNPSYSTAVGLLLYSKQNMKAHKNESFSHNGGRGILGKMKSWLQGF